MNNCKRKACTVSILALVQIMSYLVFKVLWFVTIFKRFWKNENENEKWNLQIDKRISVLVCFSYNFQCVIEEDNSYSDCLSQKALVSLAFPSAFAGWRARRMPSCRLIYRYNIVIWAIHTASWCPLFLSDMPSNLKQDKIRRPYCHSIKSTIRWRLIIHF